MLASGVTCPMYMPCGYCSDTWEKIPIQHPMAKTERIRGSCRQHFRRILHVCINSWFGMTLTDCNHNSGIQSKQHATPRVPPCRTQCTCDLKLVPIDFTTDSLWNTSIKKNLVCMVIQHPRAPQNQTVKPGRPWHESINHLPSSTSHFNLPPQATIQQPSIWRKQKTSNN